MNNRVLVIDDEHSVLSSYKNILLSKRERNFNLFLEEGSENKPSFEVVTADQGKVGFQLSQESLKNDKPFAVAFIDMRIPPGWDGLKTAEAIREIDDRMYIVIVTAHADKSIDELQAALKKDILLLRKPFVNEEIFQLARNLCLSWNRDYELNKYQTQLEKMVEESIEKIREKDEQLSHTGRLAALGEITTGVAHELNQPMGVIRTHAQGVQWAQKYEDEFNLDECNKSMDTIIYQVDKAAKIIDNMRSFARKGFTDIQRIQLSKPLDLALDFYRQRFKLHNIVLTEEIDDDLPSVDADSQKFEQIVINFLSNAQYAVEKKSESAGNDYKMNVFIKLTKKNNQVIFKVKDNGIGMSEEVKDKFMEPFFTTKPAGVGTGLGMNIVSTIIEEFGAEMDVKSEEGVGTTIIVSFDLP